MSDRPNAREMLDREFLQIRCRLLDIAAALDRLDRAPGREQLDDDVRLSQLHEATSILIDKQPERVKRIHIQFSEPYDPHWQSAT